MRVFVAIKLPEHIKIALSSLIDKLKQQSNSTKFTKIDNLHITIKFLGELANIQSIEKILEKIVSNQKRFHIRLDKSGIFKSFKDPRIFWVGQDNNPDFLNLTSSVDEFFVKENHVCHITLARLKNPKISTLREFIDITNNFLTHNNLVFSVEEIYLFESILKSPAPLYKDIKKFQLQT